MKFFLAGLFQETNSFCPNRTDLELFQREKLIEGAEILDDIKGANLELAGMVEELARRFPSASVEAGVHAWGVASGVLEDATFAELTDRLVTRLRAALPVEAVLLALHGSMGAVSCASCEGELLRRVRQVVGPGVVIAVSFDFHAVITADILGLADVIAGYRTYPHVDQAATGIRVVAAMAERLNRGPDWKPVARRWPAIIPVDNAQTASGPMSELTDALAVLDRDANVLTASMFCAHPWYDTPHHGPTLVAYARPDAVDQVGRRMDAALRRVWERRLEFIVSCPGPDEFFRTLPDRARPVAAIDTGDITTAGAPGDSTEMLRAAMTGEAPRMLIPLVDSRTVAEALEVGAGRPAVLRLGGSDQSNAYNVRVPLTARIERIVTEPLRMTGAAFRGVTLDLGPRVLLCIGRIHLLAMRRSSWFHDPELWRSAGIEPADAAVIVQKSHKLFQPAYANITREVVAVETPGCTDRRLGRLPYQRVSRPIFPLDEADRFDWVSIL